MKMTGDQIEDPVDVVNRLEIGEFVERYLGVR